MTCSLAFLKYSLFVNSLHIRDAFLKGLTEFALQDEQVPETMKDLQATFSGIFGETKT